MKRFTGTVELSSAPVMAPQEPSSRTPSIKKVTKVHDILSSLRKDDRNLLSRDQINRLVSLTFSTSGDPVLDLEHRYFMFEILGLLQQTDFETVYNFLSVDWEDVFPQPSTRKNIILESPLMQPAKDKLASDLEIFNKRLDVSKGGVDCPKCSSDETISVSKQIRRADEPATIRVTCLQCGHKWQAQ